MTGVRLRWLVAALLGAIGLCVDARGQEVEPDTGASRWLAASGEQGVWIAREQGEGVELLLAQRDGEVVGLRRVTELGELPGVMIGSSRGPLLFFSARGEGPDRLFPVRRGEFEDRAGIAIAGSLEAVSPLRTSDRLIGGVEAAGRVFVLLVSSDADRGATMLRLDRNAWTPVRLPVELADASLDPAGLHLVGLSSGLAVLAAGEVTSEAVLWTMTDAASTEDATPENLWQRTDLQFDLAARASFSLGLGDETVVVRQSEDGLECLVLRRQGAIRFANLERETLPGAIASHGDELWLLEDGAEGAIAATVLSRDGIVVAAGDLELGALRDGGGGFVFLLLVAWSVVISVMVLAMPQNRQIRIVLPPEGYVLAEPSRRVLAALLDLLPGMLVVSLIWDKPVSWWFGPLSEIVSADGSLPIFTLAWMTFAFMAIGDGAFGRTLGKAVVGCRTMTEDGGKPGLRRGVSRSFFKVFCPPLVVVLLLMPFAPAPWSFGTVVVRKASKPEPDDVSKS